MAEAKDCTLGDLGLFRSNSEKCTGPMALPQRSVPFSASQHAEEALHDLPSGEKVVVRILEELGYSMDSERLKKDLVSIGMDSLEVGLLQKRLGAVLGMDVRMTLLVNSTSAAELGKHIDGKLREMRAKEESGRNIVANVLEELGYQMGDDAMKAELCSYGVDSVEVGVIRERLSKVLNLAFPRTLLFDHPSAAMLGDHIDELRAVSKTITVEASSKAQTTTTSPLKSSMCISSAHSALQFLPWDALPAAHLLLLLQKASAQARLRGRIG